VRSLIGSLVNRAPVALSATRGSVAFSGYGGAKSTLLGAMGANGTLYNIVSSIAGGTSRVDWHLYRKAKSGKEEDRKEITSHLALDRWNNPNPYFTNRLYVETFMQHSELVGEYWWVLNRNAFGWPDDMYVVRPDRIAPVPTASGIKGYVYTGPNGEQVPLEVEDVIRDRRPNPADPGPAGRGMGAAQTILSQLESVQFSAQWNRNFFANSAVPGGIITVPSTLSDTAFNRLRDQWREGHQGMSNAARVGILEGGASWSEGSLSQRDMDFVNLLNVSRDVIREAWGFPKFMAGLVEDVNRANADASMALFGGWLLEPRLDALKDVLNTQFLPLFGPSGHGTGTPDVEFDYDSPIPPDQAAEDASLQARVGVYTALLGAGVDPDEAAQLANLPRMTVRVKEPAPAPAAPVDDPERGEEDGSETTPQSRKFRV
jgi:HK97 family phage portal protein